jgi:hypothetical protein
MIFLKSGGALASYCCQRGFERSSYLVVTESSPMPDIRAGGNHIGASFINL